MKTYLVAPSMAPEMIVPPNEDQRKYEEILKKRDTLRDTLNAQGTNSLNDEQKTHIVLANMMEHDRISLATHFASVSVVQRASSTRLSQRFLCAVYPGYLRVKPKDKKIVAMAVKSAVELFEQRRTEVLTAGAPARMPQQLLQELEGAAVLAGDMRVMKPLKIAPKQLT